jgi:hypothetical protein
MVLAWVIGLLSGPEITSWPGTDDTEAVMIWLFNWHQAPQATTERLRS